MVLLMSAIGGCNETPPLEQLSRARQVSAELLVQFTKAADASNKAVMADTDEASVAFAREAEQARQAVQTNIDALRPILESLDYSDESRQLQQFVTRFAEYRELDRRILDLAVENTNLKAQRLSFGPAQEAADSFRDSLEALVPLDAAKDTWRVKAQAALGRRLSARDPGAAGATHCGARRCRDGPRREADGDFGGGCEECARGPRASRQRSVSTAACRRCSRSRSVHECQRGDHHPLPAQHQCSFPRVVVEPEREGNRRV